jgi:hypothetical protein
MQETLNSFELKDQPGCLNLAGTSVLGPSYGRVLSVGFD